MQRKDKAQSLLTYAFLLVVVVAGLLAMKVYLTRTVQEKYRQSVDTWGKGEQYQVGRTQAQYTGSSWQNPKEKCPEVITQENALNKSIGVLTQRIDKLTQEITDLRDRAKTLRERADEVEAQAQALDDQGLSDEANRLRTAIIPPLLAEAANLETEAGHREKKRSDCEEELMQLEKRIQVLHNNYPQCF